MRPGVKVEVRGGVTGPPDPLVHRDSTNATPAHRRWPNGPLWSAQTRRQCLAVVVPIPAQIAGRRREQRARIVQGVFVAGGRVFVSGPGVVSTGRGLGKRRAGSTRRPATGRRPAPPAARRSPPATAGHLGPVLVGGRLDYRNLRRGDQPGDGGRACPSTADNERREPIPSRLKGVARLGACGKARVVPQNHRRGQNLRKWESRSACVVVDVWVARGRRADGGTRGAVAGTRGGGAGVRAAGRGVRWAAGPGWCAAGAGRPTDGLDGATVVG